MPKSKSRLASIGTRAIVLLERIIETYGDDPCRFDHYGYCLEHDYASPCPVADARELIAENKTCR